MKWFPSWRTTPLLAVFALPFSSASAELTASEAYEALKSMVSAQGGIIEAASIIESEELVELSQARLVIANDFGNWQANPNWIRLTGQEDGTVAIEFPDVIPTELLVTDQDTIFGTLLLENFEADFSESADGLRLESRGSLIRHEANLTGETHLQMFESRIDISNWFSTFELDDESQNLPVFFQGFAENVGIGILDSEEDVSVEMNFAEVSTSYRGVMNSLSYIGFKPFSEVPTEGTIEAASTTSVAAIDPEGKIEATVVTGPIRLAYSSDTNEATTDFSVEQTVFQSLISGKALESISIDHITSKLEIYDNQVENFTRFGFEFGLTDYFIHPEFLSLFGFSALHQLPEDFSPSGNLVVDGAVEMPNELAHQLYGDEIVVQDMPFLLQWTLNSFVLEFMSGKFQTNGNLQMWLPAFGEGLRPSGKFKAEIKGIASLAGQLDSLFPPDAALLLQFIGAVGRPLGDDHYSYDIDIEETGGFVVNGIRMN